MPRTSAWWMLCAVWSCAAWLCTGWLPSTGRAQAQDAPAANTDPRVAEVETDLAASPSDADAVGARALDEPIPEGVFVGRRARRFSLLAGAGFGVQETSGDSFLPELGFYGRVSDWASIGMRMRFAIGVSSIEGARLRLALALPSVRVHVREDLSSFATLELGVHAEGGLALEWVEDRRFGADTLSFGLGAGVYATIELGDVSGITLDAWMMSYGLGGTTVSTEMGATLSYVMRFD